MLQFFFKSYLITWRVKRIIYYSGLSLQSCHHLGFPVQQQIDLVLVFLLSKSHALLFLDKDTPTSLVLLLTSYSTAYTWSYNGLIPVSPMLPYHSSATVCSIISAFVWLYSSFPCILFTKSTNCYSFYTTFKCYCRFYKTSFYQQKRIVRQLYQKLQVSNKMKYEIIRNA